MNNPTWAVSALVFGIAFILVGIVLIINAHLLTASIGFGIGALLLGALLVATSIYLMIRSRK